MIRCDDVMIKRSVLLGARVRFSPAGASVRTQSVERIIEQNLAAEEATYGLSEERLRDIVTLGGRVAVLRSADVREGLNSLLRSKRIKEIREGKQILYVLSDQAKKEAFQIMQEMEKCIYSTISVLFGSASGGAESYKLAFLHLLCMVFSKLSDFYIHVITKKETPENFSGHHILASSLEDVKKSEKLPDPKAFDYGVNRFFRESSPIFDQIKWNMTQNFYVVQALGIGVASELLSSDMFSHASLYCDTNVLIAGLWPEDRHHKSFQELAKVCKPFGIVLKTTHITIEELKKVVGYQAELLHSVIDKIPDETRQKVSNFFYEAYLTEKGKSPGITINDFTECFLGGIRTLKEGFGIVEEDDQWFDDFLEEQVVIELAEDLSSEYQITRGRLKLEKAAIHDALLLLWVKHENEINCKSWIVTLDISLVKWANKNNVGDIKAITLDAFLQWMSPIAHGTINEDEFADIFAKAIRYQLLPRDTFFQLRDFQIFADMEIETRQLPAEDVEACLREVKKSGPQLDPAKAEDREKICHIMQRYFADPGTKYRREIESLQTMADDLSKRLDDEKAQRNKAEDQVSELEQNNLHHLELLQEEQDARKTLEARLREMAEEMARNKASAQLARLKRSAIFRAIAMAALLIIVEFIIIILVSKYGSGVNLFQKITSSWVWVLLGFGLVAGLFPFIMGRKRMRLLKWWKGDLNEKESSPE